MPDDLVKGCNKLQVSLGFKQGHTSPSKHGTIPFNLSALCLILRSEIATIWSMFGIDRAFRAFDLCSMFSWYDLIPMAQDGFPTSINGLLLSNASSYLTASHCSADCEVAIACHSSRCGLWPPCNVISQRQCPPGAKLLFCERVWPSFAVAAEMPEKRC